MPSHRLTVKCPARRRSRARSRRRAPRPGRTWLTRRGMLLRWPVAGAGSWFPPALLLRCGPDRTGPFRTAGPQHGVRRGWQKPGRAGRRRHVWSAPPTEPRHLVLTDRSTRSVAAPHPAISHLFKPPATAKALPEKQIDRARGRRGRRLVRRSSCSLHTGEEEEEEQSCGRGRGKVKGSQSSPGAFSSPSPSSSSAPPTPHVSLPLF